MCAVVVSLESTMPLPHGVEAEDACYLPAVETALSLVQVLLMCC
jgi:hypothetical protein